MSTRGLDAGSSRTGQLCRRAALILLSAALLWPALASGGHQGWPLALTQLGVLSALLCWFGAMLASRRLEWRPTSLDLPLALFVALVLVQLAVGNRALVAWALAPPAADPGQPVSLPTPLFTIGSVSGAQTAQ